MIWPRLQKFVAVMLIVLIPPVAHSAALHDYLETNNTLQQALSQKNADEAQRQLNQIYQWLIVDQNKQVLQQLSTVFNKSVNNYFFDEQQQQIDAIRGTKTRGAGAPPRAPTFLKGQFPPARPVSALPTRPLSNVPVSVRPTSPPPRAPTFLLQQFPPARPVSALPARPLSNVPVSVRPTSPPPRPPTFLLQQFPSMPPVVQQLPPPLSQAEKAAAEYGALIDDFEKVYQEAEVAKNYKKYTEAANKIKEAALLMKYLESRFAVFESQMPLLQEVKKKLAILYSKIQPPRTPYNLAQSLHAKRDKFNRLVNSFLREQIDSIDKILNQKGEEKELKEAEQQVQIAGQLQEQRKQLAQALEKIKSGNAELYTKLPAPELLKANKVLARVTPASGK
jgi:hypothetical protein